MSRHDEMLNYTLSTLRLVEYNAWGATHATSLPMQSGSVVDHAAVVQRLISGLCDSEPSVHRIERELASLFNQPIIADMVADVFWIIFLEYFALLDAKSRMERYKKELVARYEADEQGLVPQRKSSVRRLSSRRSLVASQNPERWGSGSAKETQKTSSSLPAISLPRHLRQWKDVLSPRLSARSTSPASTISSCSRAESVMSVISTSSSAGARAARSMLDRLIALPEDEFEGVIELPAVVGIVQSADLMDDHEAQGIMAGTDEQSVVQQEALRRAAIDIIRMEQDHMLRRVSRSFVYLFRAIKAVKRDVVLSPFADSLSQVEMQLIHQLIPYMRHDITPRVKRLVKRRLSYWFSGIENSDTRKWAPLAASATLLVTQPTASSRTSGSQGSFRRLQSSVLRSLPRSASQSSLSRGVERSSITQLKGSSIRLKRDSASAASVPDVPYVVDAHGPVYSKAYLEFRREMKAALHAGSARVTSSDGTHPAALDIDMDVPAPPPRPAASSLETSSTARDASAPLLVRHTATHRLAVDPRPPRWHEAGRHREKRKLAHDKTSSFKTTTMTPLMAIFLDDHCDSRPQTSRGGKMSWSV